MVPGSSGFESWVEMKAFSFENQARELVRIILSVSPVIELRMRYGVPFFDYMGPMVYMDASKAGLRIAFVRGREISAIFPEADMRGRKQVADVYIDLHKIQPDKIMLMILEAMHLQEARVAAKRPVKSIQ